MRTNNDARVWCSENYDRNDEAHYIKNAKRIVLQEWTYSLKHAIVSVILVFLATILGIIDHPLLWIAAMQIGFVFYGIFYYCHNDQGAGYALYLASLIYFIRKMKESPAASQSLFVLIGFALIVGSIMFNIYYKKTLYNFASKRQWSSDEEEFEAWKRKYYNQGSEFHREESYYNDYNSGQNNNYQSNSYSEEHKTVDHNAEKAKELFADFGTTYAELKKRYRKLALEYHPDHGGDNHLFAAIVGEYEYLKKTKFPDMK